MVKSVARQGRSEREPEAYAVGNAEGLSEARTQSAALFTILLCALELRELGEQDGGKGESQAERKLHHEEIAQLAVVGSGLNAAGRVVSNFPRDDEDFVEILRPELAE